MGLDGVRAEIAMLETPDGHGRLELTKFHAPLGPGGAELVGEVERYEDTYRLCYVRGPEGTHRRAGAADRLRAPARGQAARQRSETAPMPEDHCEVVRQELESDKAAEFDVLCFVHVAHSIGTQRSRMQ
jgi:hypothetical protein